MAFVKQDGDNLIQEPRWEDQPLNINLSGWKSSAEEAEGAQGWRLSHQPLGSGAQESGRSTPAGSAPAGSPAFRTSISALRDRTFSAAGFLCRVMALNWIGADLD